MLRPSRIHAPLASFLLLLGSIAGCARGGAGLDHDAGRPGFDAGAPLDAGAPVDTGAGPIDASADEDSGAIPDEDAGSIPGEDAGSIPGEDAGAIPDAGTDAGSPPDAGMRDAGPVDRCLGVSCTGLDNACRTGVCDPATGACVAMPRADGTRCEDGNPCSAVDYCSAGTCVAGAPLDCTALDGPCTRGSCNPTTGTCVSTTVSDGTSCDADASDCVAQTCRAGTCSAAPAHDCSSCSSGGGTVCSAGACSTAPSVLAYGFETGLPAGWTANGTPWVVDGSRVFAGSMAAHSGSIGANGTSGLVATFTVATTAMVSFRFNVSSETSYDQLGVLVDGAVVDPLWSGTWGWTQSAVVIPPGTHTVEWRYTKDGGINSGSDRVWIDDVRVEPLAAGGDFESGSLSRAFGTSPTNGWLVTTDSVHGGTYAARSGAIGNDASTSMWRSVRLESAGTLSFWYRVSSERNYDYLEVYVDGTLRNSWSGEVAWAQASYSLSAGDHFIEWRYRKDSSAAGGSDRAWIDDIQTGETEGSGALCGG